ncbi:unnamed protein product [Phytomonas sp. Hart1]|nr:unnamed protein product [Phytomonas sp. Hart1]|eukprot:CCW69545.1 unnamed protein product [Phytomonas sp. isolate Hart1]
MEGRFPTNKSSVTHTSIVSNKESGNNQNLAPASVTHNDITAEDYKKHMETQQEIGNPLTFSHSVTTLGLPHVWLPSSCISGVSAAIDDAGNTTATSQGSTGSVVSKAIQSLMGVQSACNTRQDLEERRAHRRKRLIAGRNLRDVAEHKAIESEEAEGYSQEKAEKKNRTTRKSMCL